jgi:hypothetical protein
MRILKKEISFVVINTYSSLQYTETDALQMEKNLKYPLWTITEKRYERGKKC